MTEHKNFWVKVKFSTDLNTCLGHLTDKINTGFEKIHFTGMILIDLQKAFDTINFQILRKKNVKIFFSKNVIAWFKSCLSEWKFKTKSTLVTPAHQT